jgi:hypothetical protein
LNRISKGEIEADAIIISLKPEEGSFEMKEKEKVEVIA